MTEISFHPEKILVVAKSDSSFIDEISARLILFLLNRYSKGDFTMKYKYWLRACHASKNELANALLNLSNLGILDIKIATHGNERLEGVCEITGTK